MQEQSPVLAKKKEVLLSISNLYGQLPKNVVRRRARRRRRRPVLADIKVNAL